MCSSRASLGRSKEAYWGMAAVMFSFTMLLITILGVVPTLYFVGVLQVGEVFLFANLALTFKEITFELF